MKSELKFPIFFIGTPFGNWPALIQVLKKDQINIDPYESWHSKIFENASSELEVNRLFSNNKNFNVSKKLETHIFEINEIIQTDGKFVGMSPLGCWTVDLWMEYSKTGNWIFFYEEPARMLARYLLSAPSIAPEELINIWSNAAQKLLHFIRKYKNKITVLNIKECLSNKDKCINWIKSEIGIDVQFHESPALEGKNLEIADILSKIFCNTNSNLKKQFLELEALCIPICKEWSNSSDKITSELIEKSLQDWSIHQQREIIIKNEISELTKENNLNISRQLKLISDLESEKAIIQQDLEDIRNEIIKDRNIQRSDERKILHNHEIILMELNETFQTFENQLEELKKVKTPKINTQLKVDLIIQGNTSQEQDHHHIDYLFQGVKYCEKYWEKLHVRLVCHFENPGIVIFDAFNIHPLCGWKRTGSENGIDYMLFVPTDVSTKEILIRLNTSDLFFIKNAISLIRENLIINDLAREHQINWIYVADRLLSEIDDLPERLHYDHINVSIKSDKDCKNALFFDIINASYKDKVIPSLQFSWKATGDGTSLHMLLPDFNNLLFSYWPQQANRKFIKEFDLKIRNKLTEDSVYLWSKFTKKDKYFIFNIINELPNFLFHVSEQHPNADLNFNMLHKETGCLKKNVIKLIG